MPADVITISSLTVHLVNGLGPSAFALTPPPPCPALISLTIHLIPGSVSATASGDSMSGLGVNYSAVSKAVYALAGDSAAKFGDAWELMRGVSGVPLALDDVASVRVRVALPRGLLHALEAVYEAEYWKDGSETDRSCEVRDLKVVCVVGLHPHERGEKQRLELDVKVEGADWGAWSHKGFHDEIYNFVSNSSYGTIESLDHDLGEHLLKSKFLGKGTHPKLEVTIRKPSAIPFATPGITIHRTHLDYPAAAAAGAPALPQAGPRVFIAVGSNIGDRVGHIKKAVNELEDGGCKLVATSRLYESEPMYVEDQDRFINGVIEISTDLPPIELLRLLKRTEKSVGRTKTFTNGPRVIDLDLVFYGEQVVRVGNRGDAEDQDGVGWLECPHKSLGEREFVLRPLADIAPDFTHPAVKQTISQLLSKLPQTTPPPLYPIIPLPYPALPLRLTAPSTPQIMAIFNATPDSFSDGDPAHTAVEPALAACEALVSGPSPPAILDIGGMSTRPGSEPCTEDEELARVGPLIQAIRLSDTPSLQCIPISVDTYRPAVAALAISFGASIINDVRGGREPGMLEEMAKADCPVVLMHSRGDSKSMTSDEMTDYTALGGVVPGVRAEMIEMVDRALKAGVKRWNIILDPGLGFAKTSEGSLHLLKHLPELVAPGSKLEGYAMLVGASRKGFVGKVVGRSVPSERSFGDAGIAAWCTASGVVDVLRVHEAEKMGEVVKMGVAIRDA
ncbi:dihydropteroate synthase [Cryptococcus sp. DSM 104549]